MENKSGQEKQSTSKWLQISDNIRLSICNHGRAHKVTYIRAVETPRNI